MKALVVISFICYFGNSFSQKITIDGIRNLSMNEVYRELTSKDYTETECSILGTYYAKQDSIDGIKRMLDLTGPYSNSCRSCYYKKLGFETMDFGTSCIQYPAVNAFMNAYNSFMQHSLEEIEIINSLEFEIDSDSIFGEQRFSKTTINTEVLNDSLIKLKLENSEFESFFHSDVSKIKVEIRRTHNDPIKLICNYFDIKEGVIIELDNQETNILIVVFDLKDVPANISHCWCELSDQKLFFSVPLKKQLSKHLETVPSK